MPARPWPIRIIRKLARKPVLVVSVASFSLRLGKDAFRVRRGDITWAEFRARAGGHVGSISGGVAGAAAGAAAGSFVPGVGTILGGFAGSLVGEAGGSKLGRKAIETVEQRVRPATPSPDSTKRNPDLETPKREL